MFVSRRYFLFKTLILLVLLWVLLVKADFSSLVIGTPFLILAGIIAYKIRDDGSEPSSSNFRLFSLLSFIAYFIIESIRGAWGVSRLVVQPNISINSTFCDYTIHLKSASARHFFIGSISLLPGTLSADCNENCDKSIICIHILDGQDTAIDGVLKLERKVAALFGESHDF